MQLKKELQLGKVRWKWGLQFVDPLLNIHIKIHFWCFRAFFFVPERQTYFLFVKLLGTRKWVDLLCWGKKGVCASICVISVADCGWYLKCGFISGPIHIQVVPGWCCCISLSCHSVMMICSDNPDHLMATFVTLPIILFHLRHLFQLSNTFASTYFKMML